MKILLGNQSIQVFTAVHHFKMSKKLSYQAVRAIRQCDKTMRAPTMRAPHSSAAEELPPTGKPHVATLSLQIVHDG